MLDYLKDKEELEKKKSRVMIGGLSIKDYWNTCMNFDDRDPDKMLNKIFTEVRDSAYKIVEKKGETSYGIGLSLVRISQAILRDENTVLPVSCLIDNYLGINDVYLSLPVILNRKGVSRFLRLDVNDSEKKKLKASADTLKSVLENVGFQ